MLAEEERGADAGCDACRKRDESGPAHNITERLDGLNKVGTEHLGGKGKTDYTDWLCPDCGREWTETRDSGLGGHGHFLHPGRIR